MPRNIVKTTTVYSFDELSDKAKEKAKEKLYTILCDTGSVTDTLRETAATELNDQGWGELADLRWEGKEDLDVLQFSISHSQGDFVAWAAHRVWEFEGREYTIKTVIRRDYMDVEILEAEDMSEQDFDRVYRAAVDMVRSLARSIVSKLHDADMAITEDTEYLADYATANEYDFYQDGTIYQ